MRSWLAIGLVLAGCDDGGMTPEPPDESEACVATVTGEFDDDRTVARLAAPGRPTAVLMTRNGFPSTTWAYEYDEAGRLVSQLQDTSGADQGGPDGMPDSERALVHTTASTTVTHRSLLGGGGGTPELETYTLDAEERVRRAMFRDGQTDYVIGEGGRIERTDESALDGDTFQPYTRRTEIAYDADGRPRSIRSSDSRIPGEHEQTFTHEASPGRLVVRTGMKIFTYLYDAAGRPTRAAVDEDNDGVDNWVAEFAYAADGAVTVSSSRDDNPGRVHTFSGPCALTFELPSAWRARPRPGPEWIFLWPGMPAPY